MDGVAAAAVARPEVLHWSFRGYAPTARTGTVLPVNRPERFALNLPWPTCQVCYKIFWTTHSGEI
jgi:hypothetical protein